MSRFTHRIGFGIAGVVLAALPTVAAARPIYTGPTQHERETALLKKYDTNRNGVIDPVERKRMWAAQKSSMLYRFDVNGNGRLSPVESAAARRYKIEKLISILDRNRDGVLSYGEARVHGMDTDLVEKFRLIDANHDRVLSKRELIAAPYVQAPVVHSRPWWVYWAPA